MRSLASFALLAVIALLSGCGPEREFSGVWRLTGCGTDRASPDCDGFVYELHLGRYGDRVSGLLVRYRYDPSGIDSFRRSQECGCFLLDGGRATSNGLRFLLFEADEPRFPQPDVTPVELGCGQLSEFTECEGRRFDLTGDDETLEGTTVSDCAPEREVAFERQVEQPRTTCYPHVLDTP
ncbi:MAG: hypothetical protein KC620_24020 [Myxococcales bacterium]|nr:hypothetical protein [Myxococcales bacterium]